MNKLAIVQSSIIQETYTSRLPLAPQKQHRPKFLCFKKRIVGYLPQRLRDPNVS